MTITINNPPELEIDAWLAKYGRTMTADKVIERRIVWNLLKHLDAAGFDVPYVYDGEELESTPTHKSAMEIVFNLDEAVLKVQHRETGRRYSVVLVLGNGADVLSDYSYPSDKADPFNVAMDAFDSDAYV